MLVPEKMVPIDVIEDVVCIISKAFCSPASGIYSPPYNFAAKISVTKTESIMTLM